MRLLYLLQAAPAAGAPAGGGLMGWLMIIAIFLVMWLFMIRPQRKQQKELQAFRDALKKGDKVITAGGIFGTVDEVKDAYVIIEISKDVRIRIAKSSIVRDSSDIQQ